MRRSAVVVSPFLTEKFAMVRGDDDRVTEMLDEDYMVAPTVSRLDR